LKSQLSKPRSAYGETYADWSEVTVADISTKITVGFVGSMAHLFRKAGVPLLRGQNVAPGMLVMDGMQFIDTATHRQWSKSALQPGDVVLVRVGYPGTAAVVPSNLGEANAASLVVVRPNQRLADSRFLSYVFNSEGGKRQIDGYLVGGAQQVLNTRTAAIFSLHLPPVNEQKAIAQALTDADALIETLEQVIEKKRRIKEGVMQELLTGKRRLPGFEGDWITHRLGDVATLKARIGWQGLTTAEYLASGEVYLVTGTDFQSGYVHWTGCHFVKRQRYVQDPNIQLRNDDVLVTKDGTIGKIALVSNLPGPATLNSGVFVVRPRSEALDPVFFFFLLGSAVFGEFLGQLSAGSTINHLYQKDFVHFTFPAPLRLEEQQAIGTALQSMDEELRELQTRLTKARQIKDGMMQELLTGRIRLV
jgi:type I restriction enzyme, S subunit